MTGSQISYGSGLEHRALPGDPVEHVRARTAAPSPRRASVFAAFLDAPGDGVLAACRRHRHLLTVFGPAPLGRLVAEGFGIPSLGVDGAGVPTREFPPPGWPVPRPLARGQLAAGRELLARTGLPVRRCPAGGCVPGSISPPPA